MQMRLLDWAVTSESKASSLLSSFGHKDLARVERSLPKRWLRFRIPQITCNVGKFSRRLSMPKKSCFPPKHRKFFIFSAAVFVAGPTKHEKLLKRKNWYQRLEWGGDHVPFDAWVVGSLKRLKVALYRARMKLLLPIRDRAMSAEKVFFVFALLDTKIYDFLLLN